MSVLRHPLVVVAGAVLLTLVWAVVATTGAVGSTAGIVLASGTGIIGASFLLAWGAETAEKDVPRSFAIAVLAVLAVAPEYAVDALYAWTAGAFAGTPRGTEAANLAIANMTGANRILIGLGWSGIALLTVYRAYSVRDDAVTNRPGWLADSVRLDRAIATELAFLFLATAYAFAIPLGGGIDVVDTVVLVGIYVAYIAIIIRGEVEVGIDHSGVPQYLQSFSHPLRGGVVLGLFVYSGGMIFWAVEPFAHGLEAIGIAYGIPPFFMIQWIAPLASESPELVVVALLVMKSRSTAGFNALVSSKLNQWTLLIGTLAVVYSIALGSYAPLPFDEKQQVEIWVTAGQSLFALALLVNFEISVRESLALLVLFLSQVLIEFSILRLLDVAHPEVLSIVSLYVYTAVYLVLAVVLLVRRRASVRELFGDAADATRSAFESEPRPRSSD